MKVLVSTDTSCLINYDVLNKYEISVFPLNVIIDGKEYLDGVTIKQDFLRDEMRANKVIKTSTPPLGEVIEYFEKLFAKGYDRIIHFTISSKLSSMYSLFQNVSTNFFEDKITVIDSYALSALMLSHVLYAYDEVQKGTEIEQIVEGIEKRKNDSVVIFIPENLIALRNGGRISPALAAVGNIVGLKPVILLKEGELVKDSMTRHVKKTIREKLDEVKDTFTTDKYDYTLVSFDTDPKIYELVKNHVSQTLEGYNLIEGLVPINVCAHCGPGTIGLLATPKINGKSINDFI